MTVRCPKCGGDEWTQVIKADVSTTLRNDKTDHAEQFDTTDKHLWKQIWYWECDHCGHREADDES